MTDFDKLFDHLKDTTPKEPATTESQKQYDIQIGNARTERPPIEQPLNIVESKPSDTQKDTQ